MCDSVSSLCMFVVSVLKGAYLYSVMFVDGMNEPRL